jgi:hypothetical protein
MSKHTPGPWTQQPYSDRMVEVFAANGTHIANVMGDNHDSNAALIAAAPDLLEALEWISENHYAHHDIMVEVARAAIAAARGEG